MPELARILAEIDDHLRRVEDEGDALALLAGFLEGLPIPAWIKAARLSGGAWELAMWATNRAYVEATGVTFAAYRGQADAEVWEDGAAAAYHANDLRAIAAGCAVTIMERAPNPTTGAVEIWRGWKWPVSGAGRVIGVAGAAIAEPAL